MCRDTKGRPYLTVSQAQSGTKVELDNGFDCASGVRTLLQDEHGVFFYCSHGKHRIEGQLPFEGEQDHYVGVYKLD